MRATRILTIALTSLAVSTLALTACGDGEAATSAPGGADATTTTVPEAAEQPDLSVEDFTDMTGESEVTVQARDNTFRPAYIEIDAGTTVTFTNRGRNQHNVLPTSAGAFEPIEVQDLEPGTSYDLTFDAPGDYPYYCSLHGTTTKGMVGAVRVLE